MKHNTVSNTVKTTTEYYVGGISKVPDDAVIRTPRGPSRMVDYLETRVFGLTVHTMDIQTALNHELTPLQHTWKTNMHFLDAVTLAHGTGVEVVLALTGGKALPSRFRLLP